jgi:hypothetical protein
MQKEALNPLFKDTVYGKKKLYLAKAKDYIDKVSKLAEKGANQQESKEVLPNEELLGDMMMIENRN